MKASKGQANPQLVNELLTTKLGVIQILNPAPSDLSTIQFRHDFRNLIAALDTRYHDVGPESVPG